MTNVVDKTTGISMRLIEQYDATTDHGLPPSIQDQAWILACVCSRSISFMDKLADALEVVVPRKS